MRGLMLAFEGLDKTGKTTQCKLLHNYLTTKGIRNRLIHFPVRNSVTGQVLNRYLTNELELLPQTSHLLFSSNRWQMHGTICKSLQQGEIVILDRYIWSGKAYSLALGLEEQWVDMPDKGLPLPDFTFYLRSSSRLQAVQNKQRYEDLTFQAKVGQQYQKIIANSRNYSRLVTIDSDEPIQQNHEKIFQLLRSSIPGI